MALEIVKITSLSEAFIFVEQSFGDEPNLKETMDKLIKLEKIVEVNFGKVELIKCSEDYFRKTVVLKYEGNTLTIRSDDGENVILHWWDNGDYESKLLSEFT